MTSSTKPEVGYLTYRNAVRGGPNHDHGQHASRIRPSWSSAVWSSSYKSGQTERRTHRHTHTGHFVTKFQLISALQWQFFCNSRTLTRSLDSAKSSIQQTDAISDGVRTCKYQTSMTYCVGRRALSSRQHRHTAQWLGDSLNCLGTGMDTHSSDRSYLPDTLYMYTHRSVLKCNIMLYYFNISP